MRGDARSRQSRKQLFGENSKGIRARHENEMSERVIGAAIEVHRYHGPGLVEQVYEESLN
jgi:hypothetical protein